MKHLDESFGISADSDLVIGESLKVRATVAIYDDRHSIGQLYFEMEISKSIWGLLNPLTWKYIC